MISPKEIDRQLKQLGVSFWFFGNAEVRELQHILVEGEVIHHCILGRYEGGFAIVCATNLRLLLIDKKPFYLTLEDIRYDMIVEVDFAHRLLDATIRVLTPNKTLRFTSFKKLALRQMSSFVQHQVMVFRQQHMMEAPVQQQATVQPLQPSWQPQRFITEQPAPRSLGAIKNIAQTALDGASRVKDIQPIGTIRRAVNPYARSSFMMRQRISRF